MTRVSPQGLAVVEALAHQPSSRVPIRQLVRLLAPAHGSVASTRASLSRTLRRLWSVGLIELENDWRVPLTKRLAALDAERAQLEADPEAAYAKQRAAIDRGAPGFFPFTSAAEYLPFQRRMIARRRRGCRHTVAVLTTNGREWLTARRREVNQDERRLIDLRIPVNREVGA